MVLDWTLEGQCDGKPTKEMPSTPMARPGSLPNPLEGAILPCSGPCAVDGNEPQKAIEVILLVCSVDIHKGSDLPPSDAWANDRMLVAGPSTK